MNLAQLHLMEYGTRSCIWNSKYFILGEEFVANNEGGFIQAYDNTDTQIGGPGTDLLSRNDDIWLYDTDTGYLYYDEDGDQIMDDAVTVAKVKNNGNPLDEDSFKSSDIVYDNDDNGFA